MAARRIRWLAGSLALVGGVYVAGGYLAVPALVRQMAPGWVQSHLHRQLRLGAVRFDPFRFSLVIEDLAIANGAEPLVSARRIALSVAPLSLWGGPYHLKSLNLDQPFANLVIAPNGQLNLAALIPPAQPGSAPSPGVVIDELALVQARLAYADNSRPARPHGVLAPVSFRLNGFATGIDAGRGTFALRASTPLGERLEWQGDLHSAPLSSRGAVRISGLAAATLAGFVNPLLPARLTGGRFTLSARYSFSDAASLSLSLDQARLAAQDLALDVPGGPALRLQEASAVLDGLRYGGQGLRAQVGPVALRGLRLAARQGPKLALASASLDSATLDLAARRVQLGQLALQGLDLPVRRGRDGRVDVTRLLPPSSPATRPAASGAAPWQVSLAHLALGHSRLVLTDAVPSPAGRFALTGLTLSADGLSNDLARPIAIRLAAQLNGATALHAQGTLTPARRAAELDIGVAQLPVGLLLPYAPLPPRLAVRSGTLGAAGHVSYAGDAPLQAAFRGEASLDHFALADAVTGEALASWQGLHLTGIHATARAAEAAQGTLVGAAGNVAVMADRSFNFTPLTSAPPPAGAAAAAPALATPALAAPAPAAKAPPASLAPAPLPPTPAYALRLGRLALVNGQFNFADYSITPNFRAPVSALRGTITHISNLPGERTTLELAGQVNDKYSPVSVTGTGNLFAYDENSDFTISFNNIELPILNPYSGRYAGYDIARGKLSTQFHYRILHRALQAQHHVVIDQFQWGQPTASSAKVPWPIRLAVSLLKDKNGVINLDVPVKGSLDDPQFSLGPIIWKIIGNTLEKIALAPFRLIGSLFAGAEKAQFVDFAPGSAALPDGAAASLGALAKGLEERPALMLDVGVAPAGPEDSAAIASQRLAAAMVEKGAKPGNAPLPPKAELKRLRVLYQARVHHAPPPVARSPEAASKDAALAGQITALRGLLLPYYAPSAAELAELGKARGNAVRAALLDGKGVDPTRVFLDSALGARPKDGKMEMELKLH